MAMLRSNAPSSALVALHLLKYGSWSFAWSRFHVVGAMELSRSGYPTDIRYK